MLVFPSNPNSGDVFAPGPGLPSWIWDGEKWTRGGASPLALDSLADVAVTDPAQGEMLAWDATAEKWTNMPVPEVDLSAYATKLYVADQIAAIPTPPTPSLMGLSDTSLANLAAGQALTWSGSQWVNSNTFSPITISSASPGVMVYARDSSTAESFNIDNASAGFVRLNVDNAANGMLFATQGTSRMGIDNYGTVTVNPFGFATSTALYVKGSPTSGLWAEVIDGGAGGQGLWVRSGATSSDYCFLCRDITASQTYFQVMGDGSGMLGPPAGRINWDSTGRFAVNSAISIWYELLVLGRADASGYYTIGCAGSPNSPNALFTQNATQTVAGTWNCQFIQNTPMPANCSNGVLIRAGSGNGRNDVSFKVMDGYNINSYLVVYGNGEVTFPIARQTTSPVNTVLFGGDNSIYWVASSRKLKQAIQTVRQSQARSIVEKLRAVTYRPKNEGEDPDTTYYGLIAEEVAEVDPTLVTYRDGEPASVHYDRLSVVLLSALQELLGVAEC